jgi:thiol-disulfide isomerase/thioredoxin
LYAARITFSTALRPDTIDVEGFLMRIRTIFVALVLTLAASTFAAPQASAPHDPPLIDAAGFQKILADNHGKPLLITFWATWCEPCRAEFPMLNELIQEYQPKGLKVVGINLDDEGDLILTRRFIARYKPAFPSFRQKAGGESAFVQAVLPGWSGAIPATFFYAPDGHQIGHLLGENDRATYEAAIRQLLASNSSAASGK